MVKISNPIFVKCYADSWDHWKHQLSAKALEIELPHQIGLIKALELWAINNFRQGIFPREVFLKLAPDFLHTNLDPQKILDAWTNNKLVIQHKDGMVSIHEWDLYVGKDLQTFDKKRQRDREYQAKKRESDINRNESLTSRQRVDSLDVDVDIDVEVDVDIDNPSNEVEVITPRTAIKDAIVEVCGMGTPTQTQWKVIEKATSELLEAGYSRQDIYTIAANMKLSWGDKTLTPPSIAKHAGSFINGPKLENSKELQKQVQQYKDQQELNKWIDS